MREEYSTWKQVALYRKGSIDTTLEVVPTQSLFAINPNDERHFDTLDETISTDTLISNIEKGVITPLDKTVLCIVALSEYATTRQISEILVLMGLDYSNGMLNSSVRRLHKHSLITVSKISEANAKILSLKSNGSEIAKRLEVPHSWNAFQSVDEPWKVKTILCCNQIRNAYLKSKLQLDWFRVRESITANHTTVTPSFATQISDTVLLFEVVRKREDWKNIFVASILKYDELLKDFQDNSWNVSESPYVVINGESFEHNCEVFQILSSLNLSIMQNVLFTEDLLQFGERFNSSLYTITPDGTPDYLQFNI